MPGGRFTLLNDWLITFIASIEPLNWGTPQETNPRDALVEEANNNLEAEELKLEIGKDEIMI